MRSEKAYQTPNLNSDLDPKQLVYPPRYALCGKRLNPVTMVSAIMSLINTDFVDFVDMFRYLIPRSGVRFPCRK